jgi:hypothetical protein
LYDGTTKAALGRETPAPHRARKELTNLQVAIDERNVEAELKAEGLQRRFC